MEIKNLKLIGSEEWCRFGQLEIPAIRTRVDSGAKTSSIQATEIRLIRINDEGWVHFVVYPLQKNRSVNVQSKAKLIGKRPIKGSFGISQERLVVTTPITIGEDTFAIELSLANRNTMEFRMLLGREAMANRHIINPGIKHAQKKYPRKEVNTFYKSQK